MSVQVPQQDDNFRLLKPDSAESPELGDYTFGTGLNHHRFCKNCGVHCFTKGMYVYEGKEVHHFSINAVTLDQGQDIDLRKFKITYWDGKEDNWTPGDEPFLGGVY